MSKPKKSSINDDRSNIDIEIISERIKNGILSFERSFNILLDRIKSDIIRIREDMLRGKNELKKEINNLKDEISNLKHEINQIDDEFLNFKNEFRAMQRQMDLLVSVKVKEISHEFRESNGGKIDSIQHQDLLSNFKELKQIVNALSNEIRGGVSSNSSTWRNEIRASISTIFTIDSSFENWMDILNEKSGLNLSNHKQFKLFYEKVQKLNSDMATVKPLATYYVPGYGENYDKDLHILVSEKCDDKRPISLVVFPGLYRGDQLNEKAVVYTYI